MERTQKQKIIAYWREGARRTLRLAHDVFARKYYDHALFCGHLALEKLLKSLTVDARDAHAPHSHDLLYLAGLAKIDLTVKQQQFMTEVNTFAIAGRYAEEKLEFHRRITKAYAMKWLDIINGLFVWCSKQREK